MRIINSTQDHFTIVLNSNRNTVKRNAMCKIDRAVNRVNDPFIRGILYNIACFFA